MSNGKAHMLCLILAATLVIKSINVYFRVPRQEKTQNCGDLLLGETKVPGTITFPKGLNSIFPGILPDKRLHKIALSLLSHYTTRVILFQPFSNLTWKPSTWHEKHR